MKIYLYSVCFNEEVMLPYFLKYYSTFVNKITIYDNMSTDNSVNIMKQYGVEIIPFNYNNEFCERYLTHVRNTCYLNSDADLVIICDIDEIIYHPNILSEFKSMISNGFTIIKPTGFQMLSEILPSTIGQIFEEIINGIPDNMYSKPCIFNPKKVIINLHVGSHGAYPVGEVKLNNDNNLKLLHYRHISRNYEINKNLNLANRTSKLSKDMKWGDYINKSEDYINNYYNTNIPISTKII